MRHNDPSSFDGVIDPEGVLLHPFCYICNQSALQDGVGFCQMFAEPEENTISPARILSDILEIEINSELAHSQIVCVNCNMMCVEYQQLLQRAETIRIEMTVAYNQTVMKLAGLTEKDLKDTTVVTVDSTEHLDSALQNFNKELMSMEDVFQMEGLGPESIEEHTVGSAVHMEASLPKMEFVWDAATADAQPPIDTTSVLQTATGGDSMNDLTGQSEQEPSTAGPEGSTAEFRTVVPLITAESSSQDDLLNNEEKLQHYISRTNKAIVEVAGESGTMYCIYEDVIESYSDVEEESEQITNTVPVENVLEYDEITVESSAQEVVNRLESSAETSSIICTVPAGGDVKETAADLPPPIEAVPDDGNQTLFIKIDDMYYCTLCSTNGLVDSYNVKTIAIHLKDKHDEKILVCERCDAVFYRRSSYKEHMDQHTVEDGSDFRCDVCGKEFENARKLRVHRKTHAAVKKMWPCAICDKKFASKTVHEVHMNTHTGLRPFKCTVCSKDFTSKYILSVHMRTHKERARTFKCDKCGNAFYSRSNLVHHEKTHIGSRNFPCEDCGKLFLSQHNLNVHKVIHADMKPYACRTCGKPFARKAEVVDHERIHTGEKPFTCEICDASFAQRSNLYSHRRLTHMNDKRFKCETCGATFKRRRLLLYHTRSAHTGERPYKCDVCDATFVYPEHFHKHKRIHSGKKPFACEVCNKAFTSRDNRNAHRYVHSDKKPFECVTCGSGFMRKSQLYAHMQKKGHLNETIVVNQPRISANDTLEYEIEPIEDETAVTDENPHTGVIYEDENVSDMIETDEYYLQHADDQQERAEHLLDQEVSDGTSNLALVEKVEIDDTSWSNLIEQD